MFLRSLLIMGLGIGLSGCAFVTSVPVTADNPDAPGFVQYEVMPLLVVSGGTANIKYIPDRSKKRVLQFGAFLAKNHMKLTLRDDGSLSTLDSNMDATAPVDGLLQIANRIVESQLPTAPAAAGQVDGAGDVRLYAFVFDDAGTLIGLRDLKNIPLGEVVTQADTRPLKPKDTPDVTQSTEQS